MPFDPTPGIVAGLEPYTQARAVYLVNAARTAGIPLMVTSGRRSYWEQLGLLWQGATKTLASKHVQGKAFDIDVAGWNRDDLPEWFWAEIGPFGESLGLNWGGRWSSFVDLGHFESPY